MTKSIIAKMWLVALSVLSNALGLALPLALIQVYDRILANQAIGTAFVLFSAVLIAIALDGVTRFARAAIFSRLGSIAEYRLSIKVAQQALSMRRSQLRRFGAGQIEEFFAAISRSRDVLVGQSLLALFDAPFAVVFLILVWFLGGPVVVAPLAIVAVAGLFVFLSARWHKAAEVNRFEARGEHKSLLMAGVEFAEVFRTTGIAGTLMMRLVRTEKTASEATERAETQAGVLMDLTQVASVAASVAILAVGSVMALDGSMTTGAVAACLILGQRAVAGLVGIASGLARRQLASAADQHLRSLLAGPVGIARSGDDGSKTDGGSGPIGIAFTMDGVTVRVDPGSLTVLDFASFERAEAAFRDVSDTFAQSGEATLGRLSLRLTDQEGGDIPATGNVNVRLVNSMPKLFRGTILDNLTGFDNGNIDEALAIAAKLGLDIPIGRLANGVRTQVGAEFGLPLSSGVAKRVGIVRGLSGSPRAVILDNPTYALDKDGADRLAALLGELAGRITIIVLTREGIMGGLPPTSERVIVAPSPIESIAA
ncbi:ABC transporter transmembrane domain-containing protein [Aquabacter cavernae]|uniref:ABC transporter transmembrane domain-containing protein n=1 Tax=Aquabacter cavernae TaxID=2496029 RepID=UPI000F8D78F3|nr:ABC transporter transmembrane domain-containing protein [Aquabacter cavernae]